MEERMRLVMQVSGYVVKRLFRWCLVFWLGAPHPKLAQGL
jgi:hypothetical protein